MQEQEKLKFFEVAHEGAFVRAMAEAVANGVFSDLREFALSSLSAAMMLAVTLRRLSPH